MGYWRFLLLFLFISSACFTMRIKCFWRIWGRFCSEIPPRKGLNVRAFLVKAVFSLDKVTNRWQSAGPKDFWYFLPVMSKRLQYDPFQCRIVAAPVFHEGIKRVYTACYSSYPETPGDFWVRMSPYGLHYICHISKPYNKVKQKPYYYNYWGRVNGELWAMIMDATIPWCY